MISRLSMVGTYYLDGKPAVILQLFNQDLHQLIDHEAAQRFSGALFDSGFFGALSIDNVSAPDGQRGVYQAALHHPTWDQQRALWLLPRRAHIASASAMLGVAELGN
jgi:hypothetical protein